MIVMKTVFGLHVGRVLRRGGVATEYRAAKREEDFIIRKVIGQEGA